MAQHSHKITLFYIHIHAVNGPVHFFYIFFLIAPDILIYQFCRFNDSHMRPFKTFVLLRFSILVYITIEVKSSSAIIPFPVMDQWVCLYLIPFSSRSPSILFIWSACILDTLQK